MEDLHLGRIAALVPEFAVKDLVELFVSESVMISACSHSFVFLLFSVLLPVINIIIIIIRVSCPRAGPSLQAQEPSLQFC